MLVKLHRSGVQLFERLASISVTGASWWFPLNPSNIIVLWYWGNLVGPHYAEKREPLGQPLYLFFQSGKQHELVEMFHRNKLSYRIVTAIIVNWHPAQGILARIYNHHCENRFENVWMHEDVNSSGLEKAFLTGKFDEEIWFSATL